MVHKSEAGQILAAPETTVSLMLAEEDLFARKLIRFKKVLTAIAEERKSPEVQVLVKDVLELLAEAKTLADSRNEYVHALIIDEVGSKETRLRIRKREKRIFDESAIRALALKMRHAAWGIDYRCDELVATLAVERRELT